MAKFDGHFAPAHFLVAVLKTVHRQEFSSTRMLLEDQTDHTPSAFVMQRNSASHACNYHKLSEIIRHLDKSCYFIQYMLAR